MKNSAANALVALALILAPTSAHSWVEQMMVIGSNGTFVGNPGYARNNTMRTVAGFSDLLMVHILPGQGQPSIEERQAAPSAAANMPPSSTATTFSDTMSVLPTDPMCKKTQQTQYQNNGSPRLQAAAGDKIALRYQENGHVTLPQNQKGKPANRGTVYIYGTTQPKTDELFLDVFKQWNAAGTGGDKRGKLLATQPFDDGQCYQVNSGNISVARQQEFPHPADPLMGTNIWCQNDIALPSDASSGQPYTLYWVWDWPTEPGVDPNLPNGKAEIYTTCMDVDITGTKTSRDLEERQAPEPAASGVANLNNMAIPKYMQELATPGAQSAQATQAAPASSPAASAPASSPQSSSQAPVAAAPSEVTVTVTQYITQVPASISVTMGKPSSTVTTSTPTSTVYMASTPIQAGAAAPSQSTVSPMPPTNPAQSNSDAQAASGFMSYLNSAVPAADPSASALLASQAPAQSPAATASAPPSNLVMAPPVTSGSPPPASAPVPSVASAPAHAPASSAAPVVSAPPYPMSSAAPSAAAVPSGVAAASGGRLTFSGTATAIPVSSPLTAPKGCSSKCKLRKRSIVFGHAAAHRH